MRYFHLCAHEQFEPADLLRQAVAAEAVGFDGIGCSDHLQPWWEGGESGQAWVWLGAAGHATKDVALGTAVTPAGPRYHPVLIAQAWATLEQLFPGRPYLGIGSGESLNESPLGADWPPPGKQIERMEEALELIKVLFEGKTVSGEGSTSAPTGRCSIQGPIGGRRSTYPPSAPKPPRSPGATATASGPWPIRRRCRRSSMPTSGPPTTPGGRPARSSCRRPSPGRGR